MQSLCDLQPRHPAEPVTLRPHRNPTLVEGQRHYAHIRSAHVKRRAAQADKHRRPSVLREAVNAEPSCTGGGALFPSNCFAAWKRFVQKCQQ